MAHRLKPCRTCGVAKPLNGFYRHASYADGHMSDCKVCKRAYSREMHWLKRDEVLARKRAYAATPKARAARAAYAKRAEVRQREAESKRFYYRMRKMDEVRCG